MLDWSKIKLISTDKITGVKNGEFSDTSIITTSDNDLVDYFSEIPPIFTNHRFKLPKERYYASFEHKIGLEPHPSFINQGKLTTRRLGAFEGYIDTDSRLRSIPDVQPSTERTIAQFRTASKNRTPSNSIGFGIKTGYDYGLLGLLFALKYANLNSQATLNEGITNLDSGTGNHSQNTGHTLSLGSEMDGEVSITPENGATGASSTNPFRFLWIENLWGNVWEFLDGFFKTADGLYFGEENDLTTPANMREFYPREDVTEYKSGYVDKADKRIPWGIIPDVSFGGSSSTYLTDYIWCNIGERIALSGAYWYAGSPAGLLTLALGNDSSHFHRNIGARLAGFREV